MSQIQNTSSTHLAQLYAMINDSAVASVTGGTAGTSGASSDTGDGGSTVYLTPDALMAYMQSRLSGIDTQVRSAMAQQANTNSEQSGIQGILNELSDDANAIPQSAGGVMRDPAECQQIEQKIEDLITTMQKNDPGNPQLGALEQLHDTVMATGTGPYTDSAGTYHGYYNGGDPTKPPTGASPPAGVNQDQDSGIGADEFTSFTNTLNGINNSLSSSAELQMINIQSEMSQRTTAIQLATSILQSYDDGLSKVADNIGK